MLVLCRTSLSSRDHTTDGQTDQAFRALLFRQAYYDKARHYLLRQGRSFFDEGADSHDVLLAVGRHGIVPASQYPGTPPTRKRSHLKRYMSNLKNRSSLPFRSIKSFHQLGVANLT